MNWVSRLLWGGIVRSLLFWSLVLAVFVAGDTVLPQLDLRALVTTAATAAGAGGMREVAGALSDPGFAVGLAFALGVLGLSILLAFYVLHAFTIRVSLRGVRTRIARASSRVDFAHLYEQEVYQPLLHHPLIGHAWKEFDETLLKPASGTDGVIRNTVRPQSFITYGVVRDRLTGLKMIGSVSGYFVGAGLLLTFVGIVMALLVASDPANIDDASRMQGAMMHLLDVASFKFSTSIAGLGVSIVFAIFARLMIIGIEHSVAGVCEAAERQMLFVAPQSLAFETNEIAKEQRDQLKELTSDRYFSRLSEAVSVPLQQAITQAMAPMGGQVEGMIREGTGDSIRELGTTLTGLTTTLGQVQGGLQGGGDLLAARIEESSRGLQQMMAEAAESMRSSNADSQSGLQAVLDSLRTTMDRASTQLGGELSQAAIAASAAIDGQVDGIVGRVREQIDRLERAMASTEQAMGAQAAAIGEATTQTRGAADAFGRVALDVRGAAMPLLATGERMSEAAGQMSAAVERAAVGLEGSSTAASALSTTLSQQIERLGALWEGYRQQFDKVDEALAAAIEKLAEATVSQSASLGAYTIEVDKQLGDAVSSLGSVVSTISESTADLSDTLAEMVKLQRPPALPVR